ncbi:MAG: beta-ketoacyl-[acyl-carrier-protein] synthase II [Proteobacteria bacterium]|nr:beta-ketoacyl-[acyl-carrier-protein] synthase II [Pseudomonadota bacterium]MCP4917934.1 beta-ketoacyl-[acyl-carrier-protein] synthase II [Pseudomonadota bacterium]
MSAEGRQVVVTAVGVVSAFGRGLGPLASGLRAGRSALSELTAFEAQGLPIASAAQVQAELPQLPDHPDDRKARLALAAALDVALDVEPTRAGVWLGTGLSSVTPRELAEDAFPHVVDGRLDRARVHADIASDRVAPRRHLPERVTALVARELGCAGPQQTSFSACAAGALAIANGARSIRRGEVDVAFCGGHDAMIHPLGVLSFIVLGALSEDTCRPFDRRRNGFAIGEGAAVLRLESREHAEARGAEVLAALLGSGSSVDAHNVTAPHPEGRGAALSMRRALAEAGLSTVEHVNCHGTGTPLGDKVEARAVRQVLGPDVPVSSIKGAIGHCIAAAGAVEAAACIAALHEGWSPGTSGCEVVDDLGVTVQRDPVEGAMQTLLSNSFGFGGQNCSLIFGRA